MYTRRILAALTVALATAACSDQSPTALQEDVFTDAAQFSHSPGHNQSSGLLTDIPVTGDLTGGTFEGLLTITSLAIQDGQLVATGTLTGTATQLIGGVTIITEITQAFTDLILGLTQTGSACRILLLEIPGGLQLDVLGLVVDLAPVELEIRAQPGSGNLLGNLLCVVVRLLDGPGAIVGLLNILDHINALL
jgi:hypothetical protein